MRIDRMLSILVMLLNRERISAKELAEKFEVSVRTVYRDIEAINMAGVPVVSHSGNQGGFGIMKNYKLDKQLLTFNDMISVISVLKGVNTTLDNTDIDKVIDKISSLVPHDRNVELKDEINKFSVDITPWGYRKNEKDTIKLIHKSLNESCLFSFKYTNGKGETSERILEPMTLMFKGYAWYLFGYCRMRDDFRVFKITRIREPELLDEKFVKKEISYEEYNKQREFNIDNWMDIKLKIHPSLRGKFEEYFGPESISQFDETSLLVDSRMPEDDWIYSFILGLGEYVEVLEPKYLRTIIKEKAEKILSLYKHDIMVSHS